MISIQTMIMVKTTTRIIPMKIKIKIKITTIGMLNPLTIIKMKANFYMSLALEMPRTRKILIRTFSIIQTMITSTIMKTMITYSKARRKKLPRIHRTLGKIRRL